MKLRSLLSLIIVIATVMPVTFRCDLWNDNDPDYEPYVEDFCYSITTDKEDYSYGDEIELTVSLQISRQWRDEEINFVISLGESPVYEILGDGSIFFENVNPRDYCCKTGAEEKMTAKFMIRINAPTYTTNIFPISISSFSHKYADDQSSWLVNELRSIAYICDSQGIMIHQMPISYNHFDGKGHHTRKAGFTSGQKEMLVASYNREYLAGVSVEELMDRYVCDDLGRDNAVLLWREQDNDIYSYSYVSSGIRFKIYFPKDHEFLKVRQEEYNRETGKAVLDQFLLLALESGAITREEYDLEMARISNEEQIISVSTGLYLGDNPIITPIRFQSDLVFTVPEGDDRFNKVITITNN